MTKPKTPEQKALISCRKARNIFAKNFLHFSMRVSFDHNMAREEVKTIYEIFIPPDFLFTGLSWNKVIEGLRSSNLLPK